MKKCYCIDQNSNFKKKYVLKTFQKVMICGSCFWPRDRSNHGLRNHTVVVVFLVILFFISVCFICTFSLSLFFAFLCPLSLSHVPVLCPCCPLSLSFVTICCAHLQRTEIKDSRDKGQGHSGHRTGIKDSTFVDEHNICPCSLSLSFVPVLCPSPLTLSFVAVHCPCPLSFVLVIYSCPWVHIFCPCSLSLAP